MGTEEGVLPNSKPFIVDYIQQLKTVGANYYKKTDTM